MHACVLLGILLMSSNLAAGEFMHRGKAVSQWLREMESRDEDVRAEAVRAVGALAGTCRQHLIPLDKLAQATRDDVVTIRKRALYALADLGPRARGALEAVRERLVDPESQVRISAFIALARIAAPEESVPAIGAMLRNEPEEDVRRWGMFALSRTGDGKLAMPHILYGLERDPSSLVQMAAQDALTSYRDLPESRAGIPALTAHLKSHESGVRLRALEALQEFKKDALPAVPAIRKLLEDPDMDVRCRAAVVLAELGDMEKSLPVLLIFFRDERVPEAAEAIYSAGKGAQPILADLIELLDGPLAHEVTPAVVNILGRDAVPVFCQRTQHTDQCVRMAMVRQLYRMGTDAAAAVDAVVAMLHDADPNVCSVAAVALGGLGVKSEPVLAALRKAMSQTENEDLRLEAAGALLKLGVEEEAVFRVLTRGCGDKRPGAREDALHALGFAKRRADEALTLLIAGLKDRDEHVQETAREGIVRMGARAVNPLLETLDRSELRVHRYICWALGDIGPAARPALPQLMRIAGDRETYTPASGSALDGGTESTPNSAVVALSKLVQRGDDAVIPLFLECELWPNEAGIRGLAKIGARTDAVRDALQAAVRAPDRDVRIAAREALAQLGL